MEGDHSTRVSVASRTTTGKRLETDDLTVAHLGGGSRQWVPNLVRDLDESDTLAAADAY